MHWLKVRWGKVSRRSAFYVVVTEKVTSPLAQGRREESLEQLATCQQVSDQFVQRKLGGWPTDWDIVFVSRPHLAATS